MTYKGYELIKAIADGEIKEGSRFIDTYGEYVYKRIDAEDEMPSLYQKDDVTGQIVTPDYSYFTENGNEFELIEDEIDSLDGIVCLMNKTNQLIQAVNQLNKKIRGGQVVCKYIIKKQKK